jgi:NAD(P)-dependent dehydrogenase (short-subunit alcohol dehydrogenase family)
MNARTDRIFITGGASGLGLALAHRYARAGWRVCVGDVNEARGAEAAAELAGQAPDALFLRCDVTREADLQAVAERLTERWGGVDVVVNNAGVAQAGAIDEVTLDDWQWILDVNLLGVVRSCRAFTPLFKRQRSGYFVNVASMAGLMDVPMMSSYNVSKAGVISLSETLQLELADWNVGVTVVCPSFFKTNLAESFRSPEPRLRAITERLLESSDLTAADIADRIYRAVRRREFYVLPHAKGRRALLLKRLLPRRLYASIMLGQTRGIRGAADASGER